MTSFIKWMVGIAIGLAISGHLKSVTLKMAQTAAKAQQRQLSYSKFSRMLTTTMPAPHKQRHAGD